MTDKSEISEESNILEGIIRFGEETAKEVMTSRLDMVDLEINTPYSEVLKCIVENAYSRIPVYAESRDNIKGILYIKDLLPHLGKGDNFRWQTLVRPAYFVPETKMIDDLCVIFRQTRSILPSLSMSLEVLRVLLQWRISSRRLWERLMMNTMMKSVRM